jgi:hypothetical protein
MINAVGAAFNPNFTPIADRRLRAEGELGRKLTHNCPHICTGLPKWTCINNYGQCYTWAMVNCGSMCRRNLQEQQEEQEVPFIVLDEYFDQANDLRDGNDDGDRKLQTTAISLVQSNDHE